MRRVACFLLLVALAGCSSAPTPDSGAPTASDGTTSTGPAADTPAAPVTEVLAVAFNGKLGTSAHGCVFVPVVHCDTREVVPDDSDLYVERPGANLTALDLEVTWTATTPATQTLTFGAMVMGDCEGCDVEFDLQEGTSPLKLSGEGLALPLNDTARIHVYAYNPKGFVFNPSVPGYAVVSVEQAFHVEGTVTLRVPLE